MYILGSSTRLLKRIFKVINPLPFTDKVVNIVVTHEVYTLLDRFLRYHQISIALENHHKIAFVWVVIPFRVKNEPLTFQQIVIKTFCEYIDVFMKIFLDNFMLFNNLSTHLEILFFNFFKCKEFGISFNPYKCAFMVFSGTILGG